MNIVTTNVFQDILHISHNRIQTERARARYVCTSARSSREGA